MVPERTQARANPARGLALIATAVVIGLFLLRNWDGPAAGNEVKTDLPGANTGTGAGTGNNNGTPKGNGQGTTPTTAQARQPSEVTVRVLNATKVGGAAKRWSDALAQDNYKTGKPDDAGTKLDSTQIVYAAGYQREAQEVAGAIGVPATAIVAMANPPQFDPQGANIVVVLGTDKASQG